MLVRLLIPSLVVLLFYIYTSETKKSDSKQHFRSIFDPSGIVRIFIMYFVLLITGQRESVLLRSISFLFCFASVSFLVFFLMSVFIEKLRKRYDAGTVSSLWLLPNLLYFNFGWASQVPIFRPFFVLCIDHDKIFRFVLIIWLVIGFLILSRHILSHIRFQRKLDESLYALKDEHIKKLWESKQDAYGIKERRRIPVYTSPSVSSAMSIGVLRRNTILVLPDRQYSDEELDMIFTHELIHIIREDGMSKLYMAICKSFHFYDPFVYSMARKCPQDIELACDEAVLKDADAKKRKDYGRLILSSAGEERGFTSCLSVNGESMKYRLLNILKPCEKSKGTLLLTLCMLAILLMPDLFGIAYHKQNMGKLFFNGEIDHETMEIRSTEFGVPLDPYKDPDEEAIISYLSSLDAYEIFASSNFERSSVYMLYKVDGTFKTIEFNRHYITLWQQNKYRTYYVKEGIDMEMIKSLCDRL